MNRAGEMREPYSPRNTTFSGLLVSFVDKATKPQQTEDLERIRGESVCHISGTRVLADN